MIISVLLLAVVIINIIESLKGKNKFKIQLIIYGIEGLILLFFIINEKKHLISSPIIMLVLGIIFILLGIGIFYWGGYL